MSDAPEMVERVASAIDEAFLLQRVSARAWGGSVGLIPPMNIIEVARAVITAMLAPTEAMCKAADTVEGVAWDPGVSQGCNQDEVWRTMIDAALASDDGRPGDGGDSAPKVGSEPR